MIRANENRLILKVASLLGAITVPGRDEALESTGRSAAREDLITKLDKLAQEAEQPEQQGFWALLNWNNKLRPQ